MTSPEATLSGSGSEGQTVETSVGEGALSAVARKEVFNAPPPCLVCGFGGCDALTSISPENKPNRRHAMHSDHVTFGSIS